MRVEEVKQSEGWNAWLAKSRFGDVLQSWEWGEVKKSELWQAMRLRVLDGDRVVGQAQVLTRKLPLGLSLYYVPRGPVLDYTAMDAAEALETLLAYLKEHANRHRALMVKIGPAVSLSAAPELPHLLERLGLRPSFRSVQAKHTRLVDLSRSEADILASFDKDTRNLVRRAAKEGVVVDKFAEPGEQKGLRTFHNLYLAAAEHGKFAARPWQQFSRLWELMAPDGMAAVYLASYEEKALAGNLVLRLGQGAYQVWAGSRRDEPKKQAPYALQWAVMQDLKASGVMRYDMWGVAPTDDDPSHAWAGISLFKKGFGGERVEYVGDYDLPLSPTYPFFTTADKLRSKFGNR